MTFSEERASKGSVFEIGEESSSVRTRLNPLTEDGVSASHRRGSRHLLTGWYERLNPCV
jgi:hypothetical protein